MYGLAFGRATLVPALLRPPRRLLCRLRLIVRIRLRLVMALFIVSMLLSSSRRIVLPRLFVARLMILVVLCRSLLARLGLLGLIFFIVWFRTLLLLTRILRWRFVLLTRSLRRRLVFRLFRVHPWVMVRARIVRILS